MSQIIFNVNVSLYFSDFQYSVFRDALNFASNIKQIKFKRINQLQFPRKSSENLPKLLIRLILEVKFGDDPLYEIYITIRNKDNETWV